MTRQISELDIVEVVRDQPYGLVGGARGTVVARCGDSCTVEFVDPQGFTVGLFEVPVGDLERAELLVSGAAVARED
jgi:hypothetical protein